MWVETPRFCPKVFRWGALKAGFTAYSWYETVDPGDHHSAQGLMDLSEVPLPDEVQVFICGPLPFMRHVRSTLLARGVPAFRIRYEVFGPDLWGAQAPPEAAPA